MSYNADSIKIRDFRTACRTTPGMYLGADGQDAIFNCFLEILNNSCDEAIMGRGKKIIVELKDESIRIEDFGAGIPHGKNNDTNEVLIELFTTAHSSGKFDNANYEKVRGVHGVGSSAVCVCSDYFNVITRRDGYEWSLSFHDGIACAAEAIRGKATTVSGTSIEFKPNYALFHLKENDKPFDYKRIYDELELTSYFIPNVEFLLVYQGETKVFLSKNGLKDFANAQIKKPLHQNFIYNYKKFEDSVEIEIFAQWTANKKETCYVFSNGALNCGGGVPVTGMRMAFTRTINDLSKNSFDSDLIRKGLVTIINIKHPHPIYQNQTKDKIQNTELRGYTQMVFSEAIKIWAAKNVDEFDKIINIFKREQKADEAADKAREAILNHEKNTLINAKKKMSAPIKLMDCEIHGENSILFVSEGKSAKIPIQNARNIRTEAVYDIRGKIISALKNPIDEVLENEEVKDILQILGCGIFEKYNAKKLNFGKLIITSDADEDGASISNLLVTLFYVLMPNFIKEKRLGRLIPPLYRLSKGKLVKYFYTLEEYLQERDRCSGWDITRYKGLGEMSAKDVKETMFNPNMQRIELYSVDDFKEFDDTITMLMGKEVPIRRDFIFNNIDFSKLRSEV